MLNRFVIVKLISILISSFSQILLKKSAMKQYENGIREYLNWLVIIAYGMFFFSTVLGIYSLRGISISFSTILESLSYILVLIFSMLFLNEKINSRQFAGILIVLVGIVVFNI